MASAKDKANFDYAVIGGGLSGLLAAKFLSDRGHKVILLEAKDHLGGQLSGHVSDLPSSLNHMPFTPEAEAALTWLENCLESPVKGSAQTAQPVAFENNQFVPFVGWGETNFKSLDEFSFLTGHTEKFELAIPVHQWVKTLAERYKGEVRFNSQVTSFLVQENKIAAAIVNAAEPVRAEHFLFCASPRLLPPLLPQEGLSPKTHQRIAKMKSWTCVTLQFEHAKSFCQHEELQILAQAKGEFEPILGQCQKQAERSFSVWSCLVPSMGDQNTEDVAATIRHMKKLIRKAHPAAFEGLVKEKISVHENSGGQLGLSLKEAGLLSEYPNLRSLSPCLSGHSLWLGALMCAQTVLTALVEDGSVTAKLDEKSEGALAPSAPSC